MFKTLIQKLQEDKYLTLETTPQHEPSMHNIIEKIRDRSTDSTALYIYKRETTAHGLVDKCRFDAVAKWLSSEEMGYKVTKEMYEDNHYPKLSYDYRLKVEW